MNYEEPYEPEIDLKNMLFYILYKWRSALAAALIFCILASVYKLVRSADLTPEELIPKKVREYEFDLARYELSCSTYEREIANDLERLEQQQEYMEKSVLMRINPYSKPIAAADIFVRLDSAEWEGLPDNLGLDPTDSLIKMYTSDFSANLDWKPIEKLTGSEKRYLDEVLTVAADYNSNSITVRVVYSNGETAEEILNMVLDQILNKQGDIADRMGRHSLTITNQSLTYVIDRSLAENQKSNVSSIANYEKSIINLRADLEDLEEPNKPIVIGFVKYPIAGFLLGVFLAAAFYATKYLFDGRLHGELNLQDSYRYPLLGILPKTEKKRMLSCVDCFLIRHSGSARSNSQIESFERISINVVNLAGKMDKILVTGTVGSENIKIFTENLSKLLEGVTLIGAPDMNKHPETLRKLAECNGVILLEEEGISMAVNVKRECDNIKILGRPVIGYVLL